MSKKYVYLFSEGNGKMRELLGGKGANLAEMTNLGLPVPQGFTISTEACTQYYEDGKVFIKTSKADKISLSCGTRRSKSVFDEDGNGLYGAEFTLTDEDVYFRITVTDKENNNSHTRAYFLDELIEK